jgi:hypothetical protein
MATTAIEDGLARVASTALKPIQWRKSENDNANQIVSGCRQRKTHKVIPRRRPGEPAHDGFKLTLDIGDVGSELIDFMQRQPGFILHAPCMPGGSLLSDEPTRRRPPELILECVRSVQIGSHEPQRNGRFFRSFQAIGICVPHHPNRLPSRLRFAKEFKEFRARGAISRSYVLMVGKDLRDVEAFNSGISARQGHRFFQRRKSPIVVPAQALNIQACRPLFYCEPHLAFHILSRFNKHFLLVGSS